MEYYTYAYLREDRTPYYIGKGKGRRIKNRFRGDIKPPKDKSRVIYLKTNLSEEEAFKHEIYMIALYGRKDNNTGILRNKTDGGDGTSGRIVPPEEIERNRHIGKRCVEEKIGMWAMSKEELDKGRLKGSAASAISRAKSFKVMDMETGEIIEGTNINQFCRERNINHGNFISMLKGRQKYAYGYRLPT